MLSKLDMPNLKISGTKKELRYDYDSVGDLIDDLSINKHHLDRDCGEFFTKNRREEFRTGGFDSFECIRMLENGDMFNEHYEILEETLEELESDVDFKEIARSYLKKRSRLFAEEGDELNIDKLMSGDMAHWEKSTRVNDKPVYTITINGSASAARDTEDFVKTSVIAGAISNLLTLSGKKVEINLQYQSGNSTDEVEYSLINIKLKHANEPLDIKKICAHSNAFLLRGLVFNLYQSVLPGEACEGLGSPRYNPSGADFEISLNDIRYDTLTDAIKKKLNENDKN